MFTTGTTDPASPVFGLAGKPPAVRGSIKRSSPQDPRRRGRPMSSGATATRSCDTMAGNARWHAEGAASAESDAGWPWSVHLPLGALPTAVSCARGYTRAILDEWNLAGLADAAELIVSELVTNSVLATADT